ncbi:MAG TPA: cyclic nucleotide-binding domain-containing protein [Gaiellaceae bacterium]|nr:cyclic nucleotide-binding domain-containing protein [Gaiellaceae bacterium]
MKRPSIHSNDAKLELLARVPLFSSLRKQDLRRIAALADELDLPAGRTLTAEGEPGREFVVLVDGHAEVRREGRRINVLDGGDFLGEIALVSDGPRTATVITTTPTRILLVTARDFRALMRELPAMRRKVLATAALRLAFD